MKITLFHNPGAGEGEPTAGEFEEAFIDAGHEVFYQSVKEAGFTDALEEAADVVAIAGGDGTLRRLLSHLAGRPHPPVLLLAVGTANNIARSLGCMRDWRETVAAFDRYEARPFHHGRVACGGRTDFFFESVGVGAFARLLHLTKKRSAAVTKMAGGREGFARDYAALRELVRTAEPLEVTLSSADSHIVDRYLLVEFMNIRSIGPLLHFATENCLEGTDAMEVALVPESHRQALLDYFDAKLGGDEATFPGILWRPGEEASLTWGCGDYHVDDEPRTASPFSRMHALRTGEPLMVLRPPK